MEQGTTPGQTLSLHNSVTRSNRRIKLIHRPILRPPAECNCESGLSLGENYVSTSRTKTVKIQMGCPDLSLGCSARGDTQIPLHLNSNIKLGSPFSGLPKALLSTGGFLSCRRQGALNKHDAAKNLHLLNSDWLTLCRKKQRGLLGCQDLPNRPPAPAELQEGDSNPYISARVRPISHVLATPVFKKMISEPIPPHKDKSAHVPAAYLAYSNTLQKIACGRLETGASANSSVAGQEGSARRYKATVQMHRKHKIRVEAKSMCTVMAMARLATAHAGRRPDSRYSQKSLGCSLEVYSPRATAHEYEVPIHDMNYLQSKAQHLVVPSCWE